MSRFRHSDLALRFGRIKGGAVKQDGPLIGNEDVAPLYDRPEAEGGLRERIAAHRAVLDRKAAVKTNTVVRITRYKHGKVTEILEGPLDALQRNPAFHKRS